VVKAFHTELNAARGSTTSHLYASNQDRFFFRVACGKHVELTTTQTAQRKYSQQGPSFTPECTICKRQRRAGVAASGPELAARAAAERQLSAAGVKGGIAAEVRLLREKCSERYAPADLVLYFRTPAGSLAYLLVQADGVQHFEAGHAFTGQTVEGQQERDARYNAAALAQKLSVARLHHADYEEFDAVLREALQLLLVGSRPFLIFSRSYGLHLTDNMPGSIVHEAAGELTLNPRISPVVPVQSHSNTTPKRALTAA
jgi:hypothetical protein